MAAQVIRLKVIRGGKPTITPRPSAALGNKLQVLALTNPLALHEIEKHVNRVMAGDTDPDVIDAIRQLPRDEQRLIERYVDAISNPTSDDEQEGA